ncbi:MAG TPA: hypothetical protein VKA60_07470 [Blastocatellia bacterium]|nr:hypothetical protein [Blastocatellia bacterium]
MLEDEISENAIEGSNQETWLIVSRIVEMVADGASLQQIAEKTELPPDTVLQMLTQALEGLSREATAAIASHPKSDRVARPSAMGKYAHIPGSSEDFAIEKQKEIAKEDRR